MCGGKEDHSEKGDGKREVLGEGNLRQCTADAKEQ